MVQHSLALCAYETRRLHVEDWHQATQHDLVKVVAAMLSESVTESLPDEWKGSYSDERAQQWVVERDSEGVVLLAIDRSSDVPVGLLILTDDYSASNVGATAARLGYLIGENYWGKGFASEAVEGFVGWCREQRNIFSISGGVATNNPASARVLEKSGFRSMPNPRIAEDTEPIYQLDLS